MSKAQRKTMIKNTKKATKSLSRKLLSKAQKNPNSIKKKTVKKQKQPRVISKKSKKVPMKLKAKKVVKKTSKIAKTSFAK